MATLKDAKLIGGIGAILSLIGIFIPSNGIILSIIGFVMILIAVKYISDIVNDSLIFRNMLISVLCGIVGVVIFFIFIFTYLTTMFIRRGIVSGSIISSPLPQFIFPIMVSLVIVWIFMVFSAIYLRKSYSRIGNALQVDLFRSTATIYFVGALLLIVIVGVIVLILAKIVEIIAFFSIPEQIVRVRLPPPPP